MFAKKMVGDVAALLNKQKTFQFIDEHSSTGCNLLNGKGTGLKLTFSVGCQVVTMDRKPFCLQ